MSQLTILITGGAGYIGSHTLLELLKSNHQVVVLDNLSNSSRESISRVGQLTDQPITFYQQDLLDKPALSQLFQQYQFDAVIHFAGLKSINESIEIPLDYYQNNLTGSLNLCQVMAEFSVKNLVFSSTAAVYGIPKVLPITEAMPVGGLTNPYARSKLMIEQILKDLHTADPNWNIAILRYFNPVGADISGQIGEDPSGIPNNLMPYIAQVAIGKRERLHVFGDDYDTPDGTGVRDYIHVVDLAKGHLQALKKLTEKPGYVTYNLGTAKGYSVLDMVNAFEHASGQHIPYQIEARRSGDVAACYADATKAKRELNWQAELDLNNMCEDAWRWQQQNPNGYQ